MRTVPVLALLLAGCAASGCSDSNLVMEPGGGPFDSDNEIDDAVRLDVYPSSEMVFENLPLLPQTFFVGSGSEAELVMDAPVVLQGTVTAYDVSPWADADLPGANVPVPAARVQIYRPWTVQGANDVTGDGSSDHRLDEPGEYLLRVPPGGDYVASFVPEDPEIPFWSAPLPLLESRRMDVDLGYGAAVWGEVLTSDGDPLAGVSVRAVDAYGVAGAAAVTDANGFYLLRVVPDAAYTLESLGGAAGLDPVLTARDVLVAEEGAAVDFTYAPRDLRTVRGRAVDATGEGLRDVTARFVARTVDGYGPEASYEISVPTSTSPEGHFSALVPPGVYDVWLAPEGDLGVSPASVLELTVDDALEDLGDVALPELAVIDTVVLDPNGDPVPGALVSVAEIGYGGRVWQATSDAAGRVVVQAPRVPIRVEIAPPADGSNLAITRLEAPSGADPVELVLEAGEMLSGTVTWTDDEGNVQPASFAVVEARYEDGFRRGVALTDDQGRYQMWVAP
jgi:hypothetical protein